MAMPKWVALFPKGKRAYVVIALAVATYVAPKIVNHVVDIQMKITWCPIHSQGSTTQRNDSLVQP